MNIHNPNEIVKRHLDEWNEVTGFVVPETGYYWELLSVMEDACKEYAEKELYWTEKVLEERQRVLNAIPECPQHGKCVPHAIEWIEARL